MVSAINTISVSPQAPEPQKPKPVVNPSEFQKALNSAKLKQPQLNVPKLNPKSNEIRNDMNELKAKDPALKKAYNETMGHINPTELGETGTEIALKELAKQFENQIYVMMWNRMCKKEDGSLAERVWHPQLIEAFVEAGDDELGEIGEAVYEQLLEEAKIKQEQQLMKKYEGS